MKSLLEQLENNEAILLMYLAGELPESDRAEVEQMLARDPALRQELDELAALHGQVTSLLAGEDADQAASRRESVVRRLASDMEKFAAARREPPVQLKPGSARSLRIARFLYPVAVAAALVIGFMFWWNHQTTAPVGPRDGIPTPAVAVAPQIFRDDSNNEKLKALEDEAVRLAASDDDPLGFRTWNRQ